MKPLIALLISSLLIVSGHSQTRSVLVGTNNRVVQPTNFWSADASNARVGLGLGSAATNDASSFQPASATLSNLASSNGGILTNLQATNIVGTIPSSNIPSVTFTNLSGALTIAQGGTSATNAANARQNLGSTTVGDALFTATNAASARTAIGSTTIGSSLFTLANPSAISFLRLNSNNTASALSASDFRTAIGLGVTNGVSFGTVTAGAVYANTFESENYGSIFDLDSTNTINILKPLMFSSGDAAITRTNLGLGATWLTNTNVTNFRTAIGLGANNIATFKGIEIFTSATNADLFIADQGDIVGDGDLFISAGALIFQSALEFSSSSVAATTRTNLGIGETNQLNLATVEVAATGEHGVAGVVLDGPSRFVRVYSPSISAKFTETNLTYNNVNLFSWSTNGAIVEKPLQFTNSTNVLNTRSNLGINSWVTNTNTPVFVNTNGEVVSPTNFWLVAPITTTFIEFQPTTNQSTNIAASRFLHIHSLAPTITGVVSTIILPTNGTTFEGDLAIVVHKGQTNSTTQIRQVGSTNNIIALNKFNEAVELTFYNDAWQFLETRAFIDPIYFSGTNASNNAAASRTNLGLGTTNAVTFKEVGTDAFRSFSIVTEFYKPIWIGDSSTNDIFQFELGAIDQAKARTNLGLPLTALTNTNVTNFRTSIGLGESNSVRFGEGTEVNVGIGVGSTNTGLARGGATIQGRLGLIEGGNIVAVLDGDASPFFGLYQPITFQGTNATSNAATTRTNLFGHGGLSTNIDIKLNNNDGMRLYFTNGILTNTVTPIP